MEGEAGDVEPGAEAVSDARTCASRWKDRALLLFLNLEFVSSSLSSRETPAGDGFGEVGGVLVLAEGGFWFDAIDVAAGGHE
jgi:hypothetical protein